jgi:hypothetical protein
MYSYTLDGISFSDPLVGIEDIERKIERTWSGTSADNIFRKSLSGSVSLTGNAFNYGCSKLKNGVCENIEIEIFDLNGDIFYKGTIYGYMMNVNLTQRTIQCEIKDTSWSSLLRNRVNQEVWIRSERTIGCEPIQRCGFALVEFGNILPGVPYAGYRLGFDVLEVLDYLARYLTDNQVGVVSNFLSTTQVGLYTSKVLNTNTITPPGFVSFLTDEEVYPLVSFGQLFEELRKKLALYIWVENTLTGVRLRIEPEAQSYGNTVIDTISDLPYDTQFRTDIDRLNSVVKVGQSDTEVQRGESFVFYPQRRYYAWQEDTFNSCSCESDKDNELNLVSDFIIDSNQIFDALDGGDYGDKLFLIATEFKLPFSEAVQTFDGANLYMYFNDIFRNPNVVEAWGTYLETCIYDSRQSGIQFELLCNPLIDDLACVVFPGDGTTPVAKQGFATFRAPDIVVDSDNGFPTFVSLPNAFVPGLVAGYKIPVEAYYIFEANLFWRFTVPGTVDTATASVSIVVYQDNTGAVELYRKTETISFTNTPSLVNQQLYCLTDFVLMPSGAVVTIELTSFIDNASPVFVTQDFQKEFFRFSEAINCFDIPNNSNTYPFIYSFNSPTCPVKFEDIDNDKTGKIILNGIATWVKSVSQKLKGDTTFELLSNQSICCNE